MNWIQTIQRCFDNDLVYYTRHAKFEMENEEFGRILDHDVYEAINDGIVIEEYLADKPYPSVLIYGMTKTKRPIHIVCAYNEEDDLAIVITVYHPDPNLWIGYKKRKRS
jgi:hypothetical protein